MTFAGGRTRRRCRELFLKTSAAAYELMNDSQMSSPGPDYHFSRLKD